MPLIVPQTWLRRVGQLLLMAIVLFFLARVIFLQWDNISAVVTAASLGWVGIALAVLIPIQLIQVYVWRSLVHIQQPHLTFPQSVAIYFRSVITRYIPGGIWPFFARTMLSKRMGITQGTSVFIITIESSIALLTAMATVVLLLASNYSYSVALYVFAGFFALVTTIYLLKYKTFASLLGHLTRRTIEPITIPPRTMLLGITAYLLIWIISGVWFAIILRSLGLNVFHAIPELTTWYAISWAIGFVIIIIPSGIGVREVALVTFMGALIPEASVLIAAVLARLLVLTVEIILCAATLHIPTDYQADAATMRPPETPPVPTR